MKRKLHQLTNLKIDPASQHFKIVLTIVMIILYFGSISQMSARINTPSLATSEESIEADALANPSIIASYQITDANTGEGSCPGAHGIEVGVILQKGNPNFPVTGNYNAWRVKDKLVLDEYDNGTAKIWGNVVDEHGNNGVVDMNLWNKTQTGKTWGAQCYTDGIEGTKTFYRSFHGTVTVDGVAYVIEPNKTEHHFILATGAGLKPGQFGLGAWTAGSFGAGGEWFGNLEPNCLLSVEAGDDVEVCMDETLELTALAKDISECGGGCEYPIERVARCHDASNLSDVWLNNTTGMNKGFVTSSSKFETFNDGTARYTAVGTNGLDNIEVDILFSGYTTTAPQDSPKENNCETYDTSGWVYWTHTAGTIKTQNHGTLIVSRAGPSMQMGNGADTTRKGFGASGWLTINGGDGFYTAGDVNMKLGSCVPIPTDSSVNYMWTTTNGNIVGDSNQQTITVDKSGTYTVTVSDCESCEASDEVIVTMLNPKAHTLEGGVNFCIDGEADYITDNVIRVLGDAVGTNNTFVVTDSDGKILGLPATFEAVKEIDFDGAGTGTCLLWNLSYEDGLQGAAIGANANDLEGCFDLSASVKIIRSATPVVDAGDDISICKGEEVELTATGEGTYLWSTGETTATIKVAPTADTTYTVTVTSDLGCSATDEVTVSINPEVNADAGDDVTICKDEEVMLTATGGGTYLWSTGETTASIKVSPITEATYTVTVTSDEGCEDTDEVVVTVLNPVAHTLEGGVNFCVDGEADYITDNVIRVLGDAMGANNTFVVTDSDGNILGLPATFEAVKEIDFDGAGTGTCLLWNLSYEDGLQGATIGANANDLAGCFDLSASVKIIRSATPIVDAGDDISICKGEEVELTATGEGTYLWSTGETTASIKVSPTADTTYTVTVTSDLGCSATDEVIVSVNPEVNADAGEDVAICKGEEVMLTATGGGTYLWSNGETTASIKVSPMVATIFTVTVTSDKGCEDTDEVMVNIDKNVRIGDYVWLDENRNGIQDDGNAGIKGISVELYHCDGTLVDETETNQNGNYQFEVCPDSGDYYVVFGNVPEELKFTLANEGSDTTDSDADASGRTSCFTVDGNDDMTIDAGLVKICDLEIDVIEEVKICSDETLELTATLIDNAGECEGGCEYPIIEQDRCYGPTGNFDIWLVSLKDGKKGYHRFKASEQRFEKFGDGSARYTGIATDGIDEIEVDVLFTGHSNTPGPNGAFPNQCQQYDMSDWEYWSTWTGTVTSKNHGVFDLSTKGKYFQMGVGADVVRTGFGASGWFFANGGDGFYTEGDINVVLEDCIEKNVNYKWTTEDGTIIGDANQRTIAVVSPGTYVIEAENCLDCVAVNKVVVTADILCSQFAKSVSPKMMKVYPVPAQSGGTLTIEFDIEDTQVDGLNATYLKAGNAGKSTKETVSIVVYDIMGRLISEPRTFDVINGKAVIHLDLGHMTSGKYIVKAQGGSWNDSKNIIVR